MLVVGGSMKNLDALNTSELFDPSTELWTLTGSLNQGRTGHIAIRLFNGKVLVIGGMNTTNDALNTTELYDPLIGTWTMTGSMKYPRVLHTASLLHDGNVLVVGGANKFIEDMNFNTSELYNSSTGIWTDAGNMQLRRERHAASVLNNGNVLITGGTTENDGASRTAELYVPSSNSK